MINLYYDWHKVDSKNRHINLRKAILTVLKNLTNLSQYRASVGQYYVAVRVLVAQYHTTVLQYSTAVILVPGHYMCS